MANILVNGDFEGDWIKGFQPFYLSGGQTVQFAGNQKNGAYYGWIAKLIAPSSVVVRVQDTVYQTEFPGCVASAKYTVVTPAASVGAIDQLQLGQFVPMDELFATGLGIAGQSCPAGSRPLTFRFSAKASMDTVVSVALNCLSSPSTVARNWTANGMLAAGPVTRLQFDVPSDAPQTWGAGIWVNIGFAAGADILCPAALDEQWNGGHYLMVADQAHDLGAFLKTQDAQIEVGKVRLVLGEDAPDELDRECTALAQLRMGIR